VTEPYAHAAANPVEPTHHNWFYRRTVMPVLALLRIGVTPRALAWSIAVGILIGINPLLGTSTVVSLAVAFAFRLNVVASQLGTHTVWLLELALVLPFIRLGALVFHTAPMPLSPHVFLAAARSSPLALIRQLWLWEWHALIVWAVLSAIAMPLIALALTPLLRRLLARIQRHQYPIVPAN
jgi:uncharacterized protein (DUF2062 family)